ncbi:MAG: GumC family protein [Bacteroidales bacterium]
MDITLFISRFLYRIRYQLIFGTFFVTALFIYFSGYLPKKYTVSTTIYTGIASTNGLDDGEKRPSYYELNNSFDNLIQLTKAKGTLERVSIKLFALSMIHGDPKEDNLFIHSQNFRELEKQVPDYILELIDKNSFEQTVTNLTNNKKQLPGDFLFNLFNEEKGHYSHRTLTEIQVRRIANSDLIEISYQSDDPGITLSTVKIVQDELINTYHTLRYKDASDVIKYFEDQLHTMRKELSAQEDNLTQYNIEHQVINYTEQTKAIAIAYSNYEDRREQAVREHESALKTIQNLEKHMDVRTQLFHTNTKFIRLLDSLSMLNGKITEMEMFTTGSDTTTNAALDIIRNKLKNTESKIASLSDNMNEYKYSKEGVAIEDMGNMWVQETIRATKARAELNVLNDRKKNFEEQYRLLSPVGAEINRREREIALKEKSYHEMLHGLNLARLKMKNIQLTTSSLNTVSEPTYPLKANKGKRFFLIVGAFLASLIFIIGYYLIIELLDRTLRDGIRTLRLTQTPVLGAFAGNYHLQYRGYIKECHRISARYACNKLNQYLEPGKTMIVNILSIEKGEGKSFVGHYLQETWEEQGLHVKYIKAGEHFSLDKHYLKTESISEIVAHSEKTDIILIEYPNIQNHPVSKGLLQQADVNLMVANACRVWRFSDDEHLKHIKSLIDQHLLFMYLNNAGREAVEDFTGQLPPKTSIRSLANQMTYMGITARNPEVK